MSDVSSRSYDRHTARPRPFRGPFSELWRWVCIAYLKVMGWRIEGDWPDYDKMVVVAAPHTSNWDGVNMIVAAGYFRVKLAWMGKKSLTQGPLGGIVKWLGCVPIDRSARHDVVGQMKDAFQHADKLILVIPPEGTRGRADEWKTGFYHIAHGAGVPIVMSVLDYGTKTMRISGDVLPSGDYQVDLPLIKAHYADAQGKHRDQFGG